MTRDKAIDEILGLDFETDKEDFSRHLVDVREVCEIVHNIFDDFESMTCKNCRYYDESSSECLKFNNYMDFELAKVATKEEEYFVISCDYDEYGSVEFKVNPNFGCNKFERRKR